MKLKESITPRMSIPIFWMDGIYSTSVNKDTLDESPMAYKNMDDIVRNIAPTAEIVKIIKPVYNFKAAE